MPVDDGEFHGEGPGGRAPIGGRGRPGTTGHVARTRRAPKAPGAGLLAQTLTYAVVGAVCSLADWSIFSFFYDLLGTHYIGAAASSLVLSTFLNYFLSTRYVFARGRHSRQREIMLVYSVSVVGMGLNMGFTILFVEAAGMAPLVAKITATFLVFAWSYLSRRHLVFAPGPTGGAVPRLEAFVGRPVPVPVRVDSRR